MELNEQIYTLDKDIQAINKLVDIDIQLFNYKRNAIFQTECRMSIRINFFSLEKGKYFQRYNIFLFPRK